MLRVNGTVHLARTCFVPLDKALIASLHVILGLQFDHIKPEPLSNDRPISCSNSPGGNERVRYGVSNDGVSDVSAA